ncbi:MAG TPA: LysR family transcriptional regulator [Lachnospiraceae bacterium]|nr:LysR family transcriptional regulator [Lachnospiraceae bacterium]
MTLQQLKYIVTVAEIGNITEAAERLYISQPSLTRAIHLIEKEMQLIIFLRSNRGVTVTREGEEFLAYARQLLEQAELMEEKFRGVSNRSPRFSVSCQHYSFAVNAFVDLVKKYDYNKYDFILRETQTHEIIDDVGSGKSEIGILYLSEHNEEVIQKMLKKNDLVFQELFTARPHVFLYRNHPLAQKQLIRLEELEPYPYLSFEQGEFNSFYYSEEVLGTFDRPKNIKVRDRATLFNLVIGLNGYTVSSGVLDEELNGENIIARPLDVRERMRIGTITRKNAIRSRYGETYMKALEKWTGKA